MTNGRQAPHFAKYNLSHKCDGQMIGTTAYKIPSIMTDWELTHITLWVSAISLRNYKTLFPHILFDSIIFCVALDFDLGCLLYPAQVPVFV